MSASEIENESNRIESTNQSRQLVLLLYCQPTQLAHYETLRRFHQSRHFRPGQDRPSVVLFLGWFYYFFTNATQASPKFNIAYSQNVFESAKETSYCRDEGNSIKDNI